MLYFRGERLDYFFFLNHTFGDSSAPNISPKLQFYLHIHLIFKFSTDTVGKVWKKLKGKA